MLDFGGRQAAGPRGRAAPVVVHSAIGDPRARGAGAMRRRHWRRPTRAAAAALARPIVAWQQARCGVANGWPVRVPALAGWRHPGAGPGRK